MAINLMAIRGPQVAGPLDFSPVSEAINFGQKVRQANVMADQRQQQIDQGWAKVDIAEGAAKRAAATDAEARAARAAQKFAGLAQYVQSAPEHQRAALWQQFIQADPRIAQGLGKYKIDPRDYNAGTQFLIAQARGYQDPQQQQLMSAKIAAARAQAAAAGAKTPQAQAAFLERYGIKPGTPEFNQAMFGLKTQPTGPESLYKSPKDMFQTESAVRKEFSGLAKNFIDVRNAYERVQSSDDSGAGDIALIFNYMKMLDPGSVVREGEFATAENAGGIGERVRNLYNKAISGERLSPGMRTQFKTQAKRLYGTADKRFSVLKRRYEGIAKRYGLDPSSVAQDFNAPSVQPVAPAAAPGGLPGVVVEGGNDPLGIR